MSRISDQVSSAVDIETEDVPVPLWGVTIRLQSMDLANRGGYLDRMMKAREESDDMAIAQLQAEIVVACSFDPEDGSKVFTPADIPMLQTKHGGVVSMLSIKASRLSGLDPEAEERLGKAFLGSGEATPSDGSTSTLP